jgi:CBS domain-containing protein
MIDTATRTAGTRLYLQAETAEDLMMLNPVSVRADATVREAMALLIDKGYSAAPVIDDAGKPVGVLSRSDILVHERQEVEHVPEFYRRDELATEAGEHLPRGFQVERVDQTRVADIMTPAVFAVPPEAPVSRVVEEMLTLKVHRLFVVDHDGVLVGVISVLDVLRHLRA